MTTIVYQTLPAVRNKSIAVYRPMIARCNYRIINRNETRTIPGPFWDYIIPMNSNQIHPGDKVQDKYGDWHTVAEVNDNAIRVYDGLCKTVHAANIVKVIHQ